MTYYCKLCDNSIMKKSKHIHSKSTGQKILDESIMRR